jgi:hypothetical protein
MADLVFLTESRLFDRDELGIISRTFFASCISDLALNSLNSETILWIVVKKNSEYFIQSRLKPDLIQRFTEGKMSGWYIFFCSKNFGGHLNPSENIQASINVSAEFVNFPEINSVDILSQSSRNLFQKNYDAFLRRTNLSIRNDNRRRFLMNYVEKNINDISKFNITQIDEELRNRFYVSELSLRAGITYIDDPFLSNSIEIFSLINDISLISVIQSLNEFSNTNQAINIRKYHTDCSLRLFKDEDLVAREMVWNPENFGESKIKEGLLKTNLAEQRHQEMLRQLIDQFKSKGLTPLGSSSIDLAIDYGDSIMLFEIKSSSLDNYKDQALKGCGQLAEYAYNFSRKSKKTIFKFLILEVPVNGRVDSHYVSAICKSMNVVTLDFHFDRNWPNRCILPHKSMLNLVPAIIT